MEFPQLFQPSFRPASELLAPEFRATLKRTYANGGPNSKRLKRQNANMPTTSGSAGPELLTQAAKLEAKDAKPIKPYFEYFGLPVYKFAYGKFIHAELIDGKVRFILGEWNHIGGIGWSPVQTRRIGLTTEQFFTLTAAFILGRSKCDGDLVSRISNRLPITSPNFHSDLCLFVLTGR